jgi:hypothetical protein
MTPSITLSAAERVAAAADGGDARTPSRVKAGSLILHRYDVKNASQQD